MTLKVGVDFDGNDWIELFRESGDADNLFGANAALAGNLRRTTTAGAFGAVTVEPDVGLPANQQLYGRSGVNLTVVDAGDRLALGYDGANYDITGQDSGTYSACVWITNVAFWPATMRIRLISSGGTTVTGSTVVCSTTSTTYYRLTASGSLPHAAQSIRIEVECTAAGGSSPSLTIVGPMVVAGDTLPTYLNCGTDSQYENISDTVQSARWQTGFVRPYQYAAGMGRASFTLVNADKRFSPEGGHAMWTPDALALTDALVRVNDDQDILWTGYLSELKPQAGTNYERMAELKAADAYKFLSDTEIFPDLQTSATPDTLINAVVSEVEASARVVITRQYDEVEIDLTTIDTETVPYYFDQTPNESDKTGQQPISLLEDILKGIQAKLWFPREGGFRVAGPAEDGGAVAATFDNTAIDLDYEWGQNIVNRCDVNAYPRQASGSTTKRLWRLRESLTVAAGTTEVVRAYFTKEGTDTRCGSEPGTVALSGMTYSGAGLVGTITDVDAMSCEISLVNSAGVDRNWTAGDVLGRELSIEDTISRTREDAASIAAYGRRGEKIDSRWVAKGKWAKRLAQFRIDRLAAARGEVTRLTGRYDVDTQFADCYIGRKINVADDQLGHDGNYIVIGEDHDWRVGGEHRVRLYLEPTTTAKVSTTSV